MRADVDLVFLSRDLSQPREDVWRSIEAQRGVRLQVHRITGPRHPGDPNRWATIARARNEGMRNGRARRVMLLDDDVVLGPRCIAKLVDGLEARPGFAALAADYAREMSDVPARWDYPHHVGMGATLFRRERLEKLTFRWTDENCECQCCCDDIRRSGFGIGYLRGAEAWHRPYSAHDVATVPEEDLSSAATSPQGQILPGRILAAFDRRHFRLFRGRFLGSLRASGNTEHVTAVGYGLFPGEQSLLAQSPEVTGSGGGPQRRPPRGP